MRTTEVRHSFVVVGELAKWDLPLRPSCVGDRYGSIARCYGVYEPEPATCVMCLVTEGERFRNYEDYRIHVVRRHEEMTGPNPRLAKFRGPREEA